MRKVELLAPAGSKAALEAAVKAGADAIYLAGQQYGARKSAANFSEEELIEAIDYCHLRGVKVFMTVNTLLRDEEISGLVAYLNPYYEAGIDAFIVQDLGVFKVLRAAFAEVDLHCSTQMTINNIEDAKALKAMGAKRIVVPREMSLDEIQQIRSEVEIEIEAFVHGALCVSVSGQCLMSSLIGQRSGNRGACAQSCRQKYQLLSQGDEALEKIASKDGDYLLSPRDLMTIEQVGAIIDSGVYSLKIEGRMKGPEYTHTVTAAYRAAIDALIGEMSDNTQTLEMAEEEIRRIFNRDFTEGFILETSNKAFISQETPGNRGIIVAKVISYDKRNQEVMVEALEDLSKGDDLQVRTKGNVGARIEYIKKNNQRVEFAAKGDKVIVNFKHELRAGEEVYRTYDQKLMKEVQLRINDSERTTALSAKINLKVDAPLEIELSAQNGIKVVAYSQETAQKALKTPLDSERIKEQIEKMGGTGFSITSVEIVRSGDETIPIRVLNQLRRDAADEMAQVCLNQTRRKSVEAFETVENAGEVSREEMTLSVYVRTLEQLEAALSLGVKKIYLHDMWQWEGYLLETLKAHILESEDVVFVPYIGRILSSSALNERLQQLIELKKELPFDRLLVSSIGAGKAAKALGFIPEADFSLNVFNSAGESVLAESGFDKWMYSVELNTEQLSSLIKYETSAERNGVIWGYGYLPVMVSQYCPINGVYSKDKAGCQLCRKNEYYLEDKTGAKFLVKGDAACQVEIFNSTRHNLADEWETLCEMGVSEYRMNFVSETREETIDMIEMNLKASLGYPVNTKGFGFTKGHFRRGVE